EECVISELWEQYWGEKFKNDVRKHLAQVISMQTVLTCINQLIDVGKMIVK
ncbi:7426_t:CDS:1, partial [Acaulospora morrowiae]